MGTTTFNKLWGIDMNNCCNKTTGYFYEDHFDIVPYGDQNVTMAYSTAHCNACGKELDIEELDNEDI